jgi:hypothetical protein
MKVALLLSGALRDGDLYYDLLHKNLLSKYDVDIFISYSYDYTESEVPNDTELEKFYKPKMLRYLMYPNHLYECIDKCLEYPSLPGVRIDNFVKMLNGLKEVNMLKCIWEDLNNFKYDVVIRNRFDLQILDEINLKLPNNSIYIPIGWDWHDGYNDLFAYGDSNSMDYYCSLYDNLIKYLDMGVPIHPEYILKFHLNKGNSNIYRFPLKLKLREMIIHDNEYKVK